MSARLVVSVHDVAPASAAASVSWLRELDRRRIPLSLLVIPGQWRGRRLADDGEFVAMLAGRAGNADEIVLHGWRHCVGPDGLGWRLVAERAVARGAGEFAAISRSAAALRLRAGKAALDEVGLVAAGFTAPGWLHSPGTIVALKESGFSFTTTHTAVLDLRSGRRLPGPALSHRPGGSGQALAARMMTTASRVLAELGGLVRIALHPDDLAHPALRTATLAAIDRCLDAGAKATTYGALIAERSVGTSL
ncbi:MAG TPA: polysaccharide deacetylase family protein [Jatrophihabitans sp.]